MATEVDGLIICPYNKSHMVEWHRLPNHLVRCRKNNPHLADKIAICPYNQCHHVPIEELEMHFKTCEEYHTFQALALKPMTCKQEPAPGTPSASSYPFTSARAEQMEQEHLRYNAHRNKFVKLPNNNDFLDADAANQKQKNLDDLDEWFVE